MCLPDRGQGLTQTQNVGSGLILRSTLPAQWAVCQPHQMEVPTQGVVPGKKSGNHPGLSPSKRQNSNPGAVTGPGDQIPSLSLGIPNCLNESEQSMCYDNWSHRTSHNLYTPKTQALLE
jgi:hypothetical protein